MQPVSCRRCGGPGPFYRSYTTHRNYVCKACAPSAVRASRARDPAHLLAYRWYNALRRRGRPTPPSSQLAAAAQRVLHLWGTGSVISGPSDAQQLCIVPFYRDMPPTEPWHCVPVLRHEARRLSHLRSEERAHALFPPHVRAFMEQERPQHAQ